MSIIEKQDPKDTTVKLEQVGTTDVESIQAHSTTSDGQYGHGQGNFLTAYFNVVCVVAGTGTLGLPKAFAIGGWLGILILLLAYVMAVYSGIILIRCLYYKPGTRLHDYKSVGTAAFGTVGYIVASILHFLNLFGCPALYLVLAAGNMHQLLINTVSERRRRSNLLCYAHDPFLLQPAALTQPIWTIVVGAFLLIPSLVQKTLHEVTATSAIAAVCTMMAVFVVLIQAPMDRQAAAVHDGVIWTGFPTALSTIAFSFGGNNTYPRKWYRVCVYWLTDMVIQRCRTCIKETTTMEMGSVSRLVDLYCALPSYCCTWLLCIWS